MENRAAVFTSQPQAVEVYQAGAWWSGELLGWRHDANGTCQVWVRVILGGVEETAWMDLDGPASAGAPPAVAPEPAVAGRAYHPEAAAGVVRGPSGASGPGRLRRDGEHARRSVTCPSSRPVRVRRSAPGAEAPKR